MPEIHCRVLEDTIAEPWNWPIYRKFSQEQNISISISITFGNTCSKRKLHCMPCLLITSMWTCSTRPFLPSPLANTRVVTSLPCVKQKGVFDSGFTGELHFLVAWPYQLGPSCFHHASRLSLVWMGWIPSQASTFMMHILMQQKILLAFCHLSPLFVFQLPLIQQKAIYCPCIFLHLHLLSIYPHIVQIMMTATAIAMSLEHHGHTRSWFMIAISLHDLYSFFFH